MSVKDSYAKQKEELLSIGVYDTKEMFLEAVKQVNLQEYYGRAKNRTMIKNHPKLYNSLIHYTEFAQELCPKYSGGKKTIPFTLKYLKSTKVSKRFICCHWFLIH